MTKGRLLAAAALLLSMSNEIWCRADFFPLNELKAGMKGIGRTCYRGNVPVVRSSRPVFLKA